MKKASLGTLFFCFKKTIVLGTGSWSWRTVTPEATFQSAAVANARLQTLGAGFAGDAPIGNGRGSVLC